MISPASVLTRGAGARGAAAAGFTLLEMIVVLAIIGLATLFIGFGRTPLSPATETRAAALAISGALRSARSEALMTDQSVWFVLDTAALSYRWGQRPAEQLPRDIRLGMLTSRDQQIAESVGRIRFDPDGGSSGGRITITGGNLIWQVGVDWISGRVSIVEKKS
jgi:general secretion pathway protein H